MIKIGRAGIGGAKELVNELKKQRIDCTIICESPDPSSDAIKMKKLI